MSNETLIPDTIDLNQRPNFQSPDEVIFTRLRRIEENILYILQRMADRENGHENLAHLRKRIVELKG